MANGCAFNAVWEAQEGFGLTKKPSVIEQFRRQITLCRVGKKSDDGLAVHGGALGDYNCCSKSFAIQIGS
jgi:hypothetical protein